MGEDIQSMKKERFLFAWDKLALLRKGDPAGDPGAQERGVATMLTETTGISRPLSDRYVAQIVPLLKEHPDFTKEQVADLISPAMLAKVADLDDKFGAAFMVLKNNMENILKGQKQMSRRFRRWGDPGDVFRVQGRAFKFFRVERIKVGDITDEDIRKEGYASREDFEQMWYKSHPKSVAAGKTLDPEQLCWCHEYEALGT